jgi:hypothetical protein
MHGINTDALMNTGKGGKQKNGDISVRFISVLRVIRSEACACCGVDACASRKNDVHVPPFPSTEIIDLANNHVAELTPPRKLNTAPPALFKLHITASSKPQKHVGAECSVSL